MPGHLITFSGLDGAGKSTQIELLMESLRRQGSEPVYLWSRGGYTPRFNRVKALLRRSSGERLVPASGATAQREQSLARPGVRRLWLGLAILDLTWLYGVQVRRWLREGKTVVCDRYTADTLLDFRLNFPQENVTRWPLWHLLERTAPRPDLQIMALVPVAESLRRSERKGEPFPDSPARLQERLSAYQEMVATGGWLVLDGRLPAADLAATIEQALPAPLFQL